jgi:flagellar hook assembly protein FlgD
VKLLAKQNWPAGRHVIVWSGTDDNGVKLPAGVYLVSLKVERLHQVRKVTLIH